MPYIKLEKEARGEVKHHCIFHKQWGNIKEKFAESLKVARKMNRELKKAEQQSNSTSSAIHTWPLGEPRGQRVEHLKVEAFMGQVYIGFHAYEGGERLVGGFNLSLDQWASLKKKAARLDKMLQQSDPKKQQGKAKKVVVHN